MSKTIKINGKDFTLKTLSNKDHIYKYLINNKKFYESRLLNRIASYGLDGVYVDCGANIGNHTIFFDNFTKASKVYSFEISYDIFNILEENVKLNCTKSHVINKGLASEKGKVRLSQINELNVGMTKIVNGEGDVDVDKLDNLIDLGDKISVIKIDVEGFEKDVILGSKNIINKHKPIIIVEVITEKKFKEINNILNGLGYSTNKINYADTPTYIWEYK